MFDKKKDELQPELQDESASAPATPKRVEERVTRTTAVLGSTIKIAGEISGNENLIIEGEVDGKVDLNGHDLIVGTSGKINANVTANVIKIDGEVVGDMKGVEKVVVTNTGKVEGNITAPRVTLEDGAQFKGSIDMDPNEPASAESTVVFKAAAKAGGLKEAATASKSS